MDLQESITDFYDVLNLIFQNIFEMNIWRMLPTANFQTDDMLLNWIQILPPAPFQNALGPSSRYILAAQSKSPV